MREVQTGNGALHLSTNDYNSIRNLDTSMYTRQGIYAYLRPRHTHKLPRIIEAISIAHKLDTSDYMLTKQYEQHLDNEWWSMCKTITYGGLGCLVVMTLVVSAAIFAV